MLKKVALILWFGILIFLLGFLFWHNEYVYSLPTPIPKDYNPVKIGQQVDLHSYGIKTAERPILIHFFNPDCPCSKFNISHFNSLVKKYNTEINFYVIVLNKSDYTEEAIQEKFDINSPILFEPKVAELCGVYSTPQAVLMDTNQVLFYRGNYNKNRYCTEKESNYAQIAIESLLNKKKKVEFSPLALKAFGCTLPKCSK